jgi:hypothetical protein
MIVSLYDTVCPDMFTEHSIASWRIFKGGIICHQLLYSETTKQWTYIKCCETGKLVMKIYQLMQIFCNLIMNHTYGLSDHFSINTVRMNFEFHRLWKEVAMTWDIIQHLPGGSEKNHKNQSKASQCVLAKMQTKQLTNTGQECSLGQPVWWSCTDSLYVSFKHIIISLTSFTCTQNSMGLL